MTIRELQKYIEKAINENGLNPDDEVVILDLSMNDYNEVKMVDIDVEFVIGF